MIKSKLRDLTCCVDSHRTGYIPGPDRKYFAVTQPDHEVFLSSEDLQHVAQLHSIPSGFAKAEQG